MRKIILIMCFSVVTIGSFAQSSEVLKQLESYSITLSDITLNLQPTSREFAFEMQYSVPDSQYPVTYNALYDPSQTPAWKMISWNGSSKVEKYQANSLNDRVARYATAPVLVDEASLKSLEEGDYLIISFRIKPETAPKQYAYIKDCDGKAYVNIKTGHLERTVWENFKPTRNGVVRISKIHEEVSFVFIDGVYHVEKETQLLNGSVNTKVGEKGGSADQVINYSNYKKVR